MPSAAEPALPIIKSPAALRKTLAARPRPLALVPTMGALHEGHAALIRKARALAGPGGTVAVSIFVNPAQFGPGEDFKKYPRTLQSDAALCGAAGASLIFAPAADAVYHPGHSVWIEETMLSRGFCGASRPGHFRGVCTVVAKLFNLFQPDIAVFGRKDYQQLAIIRRMVRDLNFPVRIVAAPTVRERDGLAMSSRNRYLTPEERAAAPALARSLRLAAQAFRAGKTVRAVRALFFQNLSRLGGGRFTPDYFDLADPESLSVLPGGAKGPRPAVLLAAARLGAARLIDNIEVR